MPQAPSLTTLFLHIFCSSSTSNSVLQVLKLFLSKDLRTVSSHDPFIQASLLQVYKKSKSSW